MAFGDVYSLVTLFFPNSLKNAVKLLQHSHDLGNPPVAHLYVFNEKSLIGETKCQI
jgi:hypothetical protein